VFPTCVLSTRIRPLKPTHALRVIFGSAIDKRFYDDSGDDDNVIINFIFNRDRGVCNIGYLNWFIGFKLVCGRWCIARQTKHTLQSA